MNGLKDRRYASDVGIDLGVGEELGREVGVQTRLHRRRSVDPKGGIEENVVEQLPCEEREAEQLNQDGLNCSRYLPMTNFVIGLNMKKRRANENCHAWISTGLKASQTQISSVAKLVRQYIGISN